MVRFFLPVVNEEVENFIISYAHDLLVNSFSRKAQQFLQAIESDTPVYVVFLDFWEPGYITDRDGSHKILTCLDCMTRFGLVFATVLKEITSDQAI